MNRLLPIALLLSVLSLPAWASGVDTAELIADRTAIERVYHAHRIGTVKSFEEAVPPAVIEHLVREDLQKEQDLQSVYGVSVTLEMVEAQMQRIDRTSRAPQILAEIKAALGNDPARVARSFVRPIVVERELRQRFEFDDALNASKRREAEAARERLLAGEGIDGMREITWQLTARPQETGAAAPTISTVPTGGNSQSDAYTVEATIQLAQALGGGSTAEPGQEPLFYFEDLHPELQKVLRAQLHRVGEVSAVIEAPGGFMVYQAKAVSSDSLTVASYTIPKLDYSLWLAGQPMAE